MIIFDSFSDFESADNFAVAVRDTFRLTTRVCTSQEQANNYDLFPFELQAPIVLIERSSPHWEAAIRNIVRKFGGEFAGT